MARSGASFQVYIEVVKGKIYGLQRKQALTATSWQPVISSDIVANGNDIESVEDGDAFTLFNTAFYEAIFEQ